MKFKSINLINKKKYLLSLSIYIFLLIGLVLFFNYFFEFDTTFVTNFKQNNFNLALKIIIRNSKNFLQYIILAPFMPIFYILDCLYTSWAISISLNTNGLFQTLIKIIPHGVIEIPNFAFYTYISFIIMKNFYSNFNKKNYSLIKDIFAFKEMLIFSWILIVVSGMIEGIIT